MPIPFDDLTEPNIDDSVAWLRFVAEEEGDGIRGALFETSSLGDPLSFSFTRADLSAQSSSHSDTVDWRQAAVFSLTKSLLKSATGSPKLILGLADEIPLWIVNEALRVRLPFCRVNFSSESAPHLMWAAEQPQEGTRAHQSLDRIMRRDDPFEAFSRAANCLSKAFEYRRVRGITTFTGLNTVVSLCRPEVENERSYPPAEHLWELLELGQDDGWNEQSPLPAPWVSQMEWPGKLMPFQIDGVHALLEMNQLLLADDMGLGKTIQTIAAVRILRARGEIETCLVIAPASILDQWRREITKWAPELSAMIVRGPAHDRNWQWLAHNDVKLVSYGVLRQDVSRLIEMRPSWRMWDVVVADETQRIKNRNDTSDAVKSLQRVRSWALTGTPIENNEEELASIMEFVDHDGDSQPKRYFPGIELLNRHKEVQLRRKKNDVLNDLPPKLETKLAIELGPRQSASYAKAEEDGIVFLKSLGAEVRVRHVLELLTRLKQICNFDPVTGESSKLDDIKERLEQLAVQGHKALVFSQYTNEVFGVKAAAEFLREFSPVTLTGDMPLEDRSVAIERFRGRDEHKAMVISLRAGGLGLNLQEASYVFHLDRWWNPAVERQAEDRAHRMGQTVKVNVIKYSCVGTIEERIDQILERKQKLFDQLIDDVSLDLSAKFSGEELFSLFGLDPPSVNGS